MRARKILWSDVQEKPKTAADMRADILRDLQGKVVEILEGPSDSQGILTALVPFQIRLKCELLKFRPSPMSFLI
jgi:hypothetical protein